MIPKVAIILPTYNVREYIKEMVTALYLSTNFPFKLIVVDGCSEDGIEKEIEKLKVEFLPRLEIDFYQIPKKGLVNAINFGIEKAGDLDVYLTQADVIHYKLFKRDWLEDMYDVAKDEKAGLITSTAGWGTSGDDFINGFNWIGTWNCYIPRRVINKVGLFDEQFFGGDDIDYSYRVVKEGFDNLVMNCWVHHHQLTDRNDTHSEVNLRKMYKLLRKKWKLGEFKDEN